MNCKTCGKLLTKKSQKQYCSRKCANARAKKGKMFTCPTCKKQFYLSPSQIKHYRGFCSMQCSRGIVKRKGHCIICGKVFDCKSNRDAQNKKYCSLECLGKSRQIRKTVCCIVCGTKITRRVSRIKRSDKPVCSKKCFIASISGKNSHVWTGGTNSYRGTNWHRQRNKARKRDSDTCQVCGKTKRDVGQELDVHHIRPYRLFNNDYRVANNLNNLVTLCRQCHLATEIPLKKMA